MSALLSNAILLSLFLFSLAMVLTLIRLFKGPSAQDRTGAGLPVHPGDADDAGAGHSLRQ